MLGFSAQEVLSTIMAIPSGGLSKNQYDTYRQQVWNAYANQLFNVVVNYRNAGELTYSGLAAYIDVLQELAQSFNAGSERFRASIGSWVDSRFHDFYDPMMVTLGQWQAELTTLPNDIITSIVEGDTGMPLPSFTFPAIDGMPVQEWVNPAPPIGDNQSLMPLDVVTDIVQAIVPEQNTGGTEMLGFTASAGGVTIDDTGGGINVGAGGINVSLPQPSGGSGGLTSKEYDAYRQAVWDVYSKNLFNVVTDYRNKGKLTYSGLSSYISALEGLMDNFAAVTDKFRARLSQSWIEPRFRDFYDPMAATLNSWRSELSTLPSDIIASILGGGTGMPTPNTSSATGTGTAGVPHTSSVISQQPILGGNTLTYIAIGVGIYLLARKR